MAVLSSIDKWQDAFVEYSVPELQHLNVQLREHVTAKKQELRDLVGNRYRDMLKTADIILSMNDTVGKEDDALSDLCTAGKYSSWATHAANVAKFTNPQNSSSTNSNSLGQQATEKILHSIVLFTKRHVRGFKSHYNYEFSYHQDHVLVARGLWLAQLLMNDAKCFMGKRKFNLINADLNQLANKFQHTIRLLLLRGEGSEFIDFSSYNSLFLAYSISHQCDLAETLKVVLNARLDHISECLDNCTNGQPESTFPYILRLISGTFSTVKTGFGKNTLQRAIFQQTEVYSLLGAPEFANKAELSIVRYQSWLPEHIKVLRAFPISCSENIINSGRPSAKLSAALTSQLLSFGRKIVEIMILKLPVMFECINDLHSLVELYRQVLAIVQDSSSLRDLSLRGDEGDDSETFYRSIFLPLWVDRFNCIVETEIDQLLNTEESLSKIHEKILSNSIETPNGLSTTDFIFSTDFLADSASIKGAHYATILIDALSDFASGSIGDIKTISHEYKSWLDSVSAVLGHIEEVGKMKGHLSVRYDTGTTKETGDEFDDEESAEFWRRTEKKAISANHKLFGEHASKSLTRVHGEMLKRVEKLSAQNGNNTRGLVLLLRAVLLLESYFISVAPVSQDSSQKFVMSAYERLGDCVSNSLLELIDANLYLADSGSRELWIENDRYPSGPSLYIFDYLSKLVRNLVADVGNDELLWCNDKGLQVLQRKVGESILGKLNSASENLEALLNSSLEPKSLVQFEPVSGLVSDNKSAASEEALEDVEDKETNTDTENNKDDVSEIPEVQHANHFKLETCFLQMTLDSRYISQLIGVSYPQDPKYAVNVPDDTLQKMDKAIQEVVKRTRILYLPLAV